MHSKYPPQQPQHLNNNGSRDPYSRNDEQIAVGWILNTMYENEEALKNGAEALKEQARQGMFFLVNHCLTYFSSASTFGSENL